MIMSYGRVNLEGGRRQREFLIFEIVNMALPHSGERPWWSCSPVIRSESKSQLHRDQGMVSERCRLLLLIHLGVI
jgi:hypothetical protein